MKTCTICKAEQPLDSFWPDRRRKNGLMARCKSCNTEQARAYRAAHPNREKAIYARTKTEVRERHLIRKYGVNLTDYAAMLLAQGGKCAICRAPEENQFKGVFHVDHCHTTGKVRGLLCRGCNHMLGVVGDDPKILLRAVEYLVPPLAAQVIGAYLDAEKPYGGCTEVAEVDA
jgi:hypothetical protein